MNNQPVLDVDTEVFFEGKPSGRLLIRTLVHTCISGGIAVGVGMYVDWNLIRINAVEYIEGVYNNGLTWQASMVGVVLVLGIITLLRPVFDVYFLVATKYRLTNDRIEYERGLMALKIVNVELWRVKDIFFRRTLLHFFLRIGVIEITALDESIPKLEIGPIREARKIYDQLKLARLRSGRLAGAQAMGMGSAK